MASNIGPDPRRLMEIPLHRAGGHRATFTKVPLAVFNQLGLESAHEAEIGDGRTTRRILALAGVETGAAPRPVLASAGGDRLIREQGYT